MSTMTVSSGLYKSYSHISSGKRINSAADDAAGLAIGKKMEREERGLLVGAENTKDGIGMLNVADGALDGIMDHLQRIRELGLRSMNGLNSDSDREAYQTEIDQLKEGIQSIAKNTSFNERALLDGSMADLHLATNPSGGGLDIGMEDATLQALGIADLDVTSADFNLDAIDKAMKMVSEQRSGLGASTNRLEYTYNYNLSAHEEQLGARSRIEDLDMPKAISEQKKEELLSQYRNLMLRKKMDQKANVLRLFQ
ncbi:MAG: flagellin [Lachnoclostridium sp.]|nr:flagellin [Lachnospira sp.]MCM1248665.1 flagellin [Lachnoclostridium sp.]